MNFKPLVWAFILIELALFHASGANPDSRLAAMAAYKDHGTFAIERDDWTFDVSLGPDGKLYSNKAPGPILLGLPIFWVIDELVLGSIDRNDREAVYQKRKKSKDAYYVPLCLFLQIIPFVWIVLKLLAFLPQGSPQVLFVGLCFFANTASNFMNTYFGHGFAAVWLLYMLYGVLASSWFQIGLGFGLALLSDYGAAVFFPALVALGFKNQEKQKIINNFKFLIFGGLIPGILWVGYHTLTFGGPFEVALKFQHPQMHLVANETNNIWGIFKLLPEWRVVVELLVGFKRGILWTQPWVFLAIYFILKNRRQLNGNQKSFIFWLVPTFGFLVLLNGNFGGWWGGGSTGPRYLSLMFPLFAFALATFFKGLNKVQSRWVVGTALFAGVFWALTFATSIHAPLTPLWPWFWSQFSGEKSLRSLGRLMFAIIILSVSFWKFKRLEKVLKSET